MNAKNANYRKNNDRSKNSSTYHKKDGTDTRAILKEEGKNEIMNADFGISKNKYK